MMKKSKSILILTGAAIVLFGLSYGGYKLSKSRTFQFGGEIVNRIETTEKVVALTFDDGPTEKTETVLNALEKADISTTFFLTGKEMAENEQKTAQIIRAGHEIGNHSYSHDRMVLKSMTFIAEEIDLTNELIKKSGHEGEIYFRAPYCKKLFALPSALKKREMTHITWDVEPDTYMDKNASPNEVAEYVLENVRPGSIVLMHVMYETGQTDIDALPIIINALKEKGYRFLTISEMMAIKN